MANPLEELRAANDSYHAAANEIMEANAEAFGVSVSDMTEVKARFGFLHENIFALMRQAQELLVPYFGGSD